MSKKSGVIMPLIKNTVNKNPALSIGLVSAVAAGVVLSLLPPLVLEKIVNSFGSENNILMSALLYFLCLALSGVFDSLREMLITVFGQKITHSLRSTLCKKLSGLKSSYFPTVSPGAVVSLFVNDVDTVEVLFASGVIGMASDACKVISILAVVFVKSRGLGWLLLAVTPLIYLFTRRTQKKMLASQLRYRASVGRVTDFLPETTANIRMIHSFGKEKFMSRIYGERIKESYSALERTNFYDAVYSPVINIISAAVIGVMMVFAAGSGSMRAFFGMSAGTAVAIIAYVGKIFSPIESIGMEIQSIQSAIAGVKRISAFMLLENKSAANGSISLEWLGKEKKTAVEIKDLHFSYNEEKEVLSGVSFSAEEGSFTTLAGRTGAGKSTVIKLISGLYEPESGEVLIYGEKASAIPDCIKRKLFGYVDQSFKAVRGSVFDQIAVFDENISLEDAENAATLVGLSDMIASLPEGYNTPYNEALFSQGQRQLLGIARAVAFSPLILLLDEITADLDAETEKKVLAALIKASEQRTVISVSHRLYEHTGGKKITIE